MSQRKQAPRTPPRQPRQPAGIESNSATAVQRRLATTQVYRAGGIAQTRAPQPTKAPITVTGNATAAPVAALPPQAAAANPAEPDENPMSERVNALLTQLFRLHTERVHHMAESKRIDKECKEIKEELSTFMRTTGIERLVNQEEGKAFVSKVAYRKRKAKLRDCLDLIQRRDGLERRREYESMLQQLADERVTYRDSRITLLGQRRAGEHHPCAQPRRRRRTSASDGAAESQQQ